MSGEVARGRAVLGAAYAAGLAAAVAAALALPGRHPVLVAAAADVAATLAVFAFSVAFRSSSVYDPYWSVAPIPIVLFWAASGEGADPLRRAGVIALVAAWGVRLTWNQLARWGGLGDEDFRYVELRARAGRLYWPLSLAGIHLLPTAWVFLGLAAAWPALGASSRPAGLLDLAALAVGGGAVLLEAVADLQLRRFLAARSDRTAVLETGVWAFCRHPNYLGEILFWWALWLAGAAAAPAYAWTAVGPVAITTLFVAVSIPWKDRRMLAGHPAYGARLREVPALLPFPRRAGHP